MIAITKLPHGWPTDKLTRRTDWNGLIVIAHPDRAPHTSRDGGKTWEEVKPIDVPDGTVIFKNVVIFP